MFIEITENRSHTSKLSKSDCQYISWQSRNICYLKIQVKHFYCLAALLWNVPFYTTNYNTKKRIPPKKDHFFDLLLFNKPQSTFIQEESYDYLIKNWNNNSGHDDKHCIERPFPGCIRFCALVQTVIIDKKSCAEYQGNGRDCILEEHIRDEIVNNRTNYQ